jgi:hypothetical protein
MHVPKKKRKLKVKSWCALSCNQRTTTVQLQFPSFPPQWMDLDKSRLAHKQSITSYLIHLPRQYFYYFYSINKLIKLLVLTNMKINYQQKIYIL